MAVQGCPPATTANKKTNAHLLFTIRSGLVNARYSAHTHSVVIFAFLLSHRNCRSRRSRQQTPYQQDASFHAPLTGTLTGSILRPTPKSCRSDLANTFAISNALWRILQAQQVNTECPSAQTAGHLPTAAQLGQDPTKRRSVLSTECNCIKDLAQ